jgi:hypothetical protein
LPGVITLWLSGDTDNGYRAYKMLQELIEVYAKYGYNIILAPLAPGHAFSRTDAHIAHLNALIKLIKAFCRIFGAHGVAEVMHAAADPKLAKKRSHMYCSFVFFRRVEGGDDADKKGANIGRR